MLKSFSGKTWNFKECDEYTLSEITSSLNLGNLASKILINRGFKSKSEIEAFLNAKLRNTIPDPSLILDMDKAIERVYKSISNKENIMVLGDYDVDGITSTYLVVKYLRTIGLNPNYYIPNRFIDGYGVSENSIEVTIQNKADLVIAVDSGTNSVDEIKTAKDLGIDFVVLDHHTQTCSNLPEAVAVVNPNRVDQKEIDFSHIKNLCAAGVVFLFLIGLQRKLRDSEFFKNIDEPNLLQFADVITLGTLCDVMDLRGINRAITRYAMTKGEFSQGITSLMNVFGIEKISSPDDLSFFIGPAINAAGRVGDPHIALNLLLEESPEISFKIAKKLVELNNTRKEMEKHLFADALYSINSLNLSQNKGICVYGESWNEGVIGIVAGKLKDKFQKPVFVISVDKNGVGKGSARSVNGIHLGKFLEKAINNGIILKGGGHALAGGFSILKDKIPEFQDFINFGIEGEFVNSLDIDASLSALSDLNKIYKEIMRIEPFGKSIEKPKFCFKRLRIRSIKKTTSGSHLMINFSGELGKGSLKTLLFNTNSKIELVREINQNESELMDIVGTINYSEQFGSSIIIEDIRLSSI